MADEMTIESWPFTYPLRVRWAESDIQGVVFNGNYLTYFDVGITEYLRAVFGGDATKLYAIFEDLYVVKSVVEYQSPARFDEMIDIAVRTSRFGRTSLTFAFQISRNGQALVGGENIYVHAPNGDPAPIPATLRDAIEQFEAQGGHADCAGA